MWLDCFDETTSKSCSRRGALRKEACERRGEKRVYQYEDTVQYKPHCGGLGSSGEAFCLLRGNVLYRYWDEYLRPTPANVLPGRSTWSIRCRSSMAYKPSHHGDHSISFFKQVPMTNIVEHLILAAIHLLIVLLAKGRRRSLVVCSRQNEGRTLQL
jgi:hypothetical protein